jgi:hypothetical protein
MKKKIPIKFAKLIYCYGKKYIYIYHPRSSLHRSIVMEKYITPKAHYTDLLLRKIKILPITKKNFLIY